MIEMLTDNHFERIMGLFDRATKSIKIISPFLTESMAEKLCNAKARGIDCSFITRLYVQDLAHKANTADGLERMIDSGIAVYAVKGLHTKLYLFDDTEAIVGSANFTYSGLNVNLELSLLLSEEERIADLNGYFSKLHEQIVASGDGIISPEMLKESRELCEHLYKGNKSVSITTRSIKMYGADLGKNPINAEKELKSCEGESDPIFDMMRENEVIEQINYDHSIWLKFDGEAESRIGGDQEFPLVRVELNGKKVYVQNYPKRPRMVKDGDEVYLAAITTDKAGKNQPVIVGRGYLRGFKDTNRVDESWEEENTWMDRYPWFCVMDDCEILDTSVENGIPLDSVCMALGSDTYLVSFGRKEDIPTVARKHYQKAHLRLSGNAKAFIDKRFDELKKQYGVKTITSEKEE